MTKLKVHMGNRSPQWIIWTMRATLSTRALESRLAPETNPTQICQYKGNCRLRLHLSIHHLNPLPCLYAQEVVPQNRRQASMGRGVDLIQTKQKRAAREQRNKYKPRTETRGTPSNQTRRQAGGLPLWLRNLHVLSMNLSTFALWG